jgi:thioredoxin-related protein
MKLIGLLFLIPALLLAQDNTETTVSLNGEVKWYTIEEAIALTQKEPRKIFVDVYTDWCGWCKVMDKNTFSHEIVADYLNTTYYPVKLNAEQKEDIILGATTYKYVPNGNRGYHELAAALLQGKLSYPSVVFISEKVEVLNVVPGYNKPKEFDQIARFIGDNHYLTKTFDDFVAEYVSPIKE